jgi:hypothetical protein
VAATTADQVATAVVMIGLSGSTVRRVASMPLKYLPAIRGHLLLQARRVHDDVAHRLHAIAGDRPDALDDVVENLGVGGLQRVNWLDLLADTGEGDLDRASMASTGAMTMASVVGNSSVSAASEMSAAAATSARAVLS